MSKVRALVARFEKTKLSAQLFRVVRLGAVGVLTAVVTGSAIDTASVTAIFETAFRAVFA